MVSKETSESPRWHQVVGSFWPNLRPNNRAAWPTPRLLLLPRSTTRRTWGVVGTVPSPACLAGTHVFLVSYT